MATRSEYNNSARRTLAALAALLAAALVAASAPVPVLGSDTAGACPPTSSNCGG